MPHVSVVICEEARPGAKSIKSSVAVGRIKVKTGEPHSPVARAAAATNSPGVADKTHCHPSSSPAAPECAPQDCVPEQGCNNTVHTGSVRDVSGFPRLSNIPEPPANG